MKTKLCLLGIIGTLLSSSPLAHAATRTWDGGGADNFWTNAANWGGTAPVAGDNLIFPGTAPADSLVNTNNFPANTTFGSITITGTNYNLSPFGNAIILTNGISHQSGGTNTVAMTISLGASQTFESTIGTGGLTVSGSLLNLNGRDLTNDTIGLTTISRAISGTGNLLKRGTGTLRLQGTANTYTGSMTVEEGVLELNKAAAFVSIPGPLIIGDSIGAVNSAVVRLFSADQISDTSAVTIEDDGLLDLSAFSDAIGPLTTVGGDVTMLAGTTLTLGGDVTANASTNTASISGNLSLGSATRTFNIAAGTASPELAISAVVSGDAGAGITKTGSGSLRLSGANTYSGLTAVNFGALEVLNPSALGSTASGTTLGSGSFLLLSGVTVAGESLTIVGTSAPITSSGAAGWSGNIVLNGSLVLQVNSGTNTISGDISGPGGLVKNNPGTLILSGTNENTYAGTTTVNVGTLLLNKSVGTNAVSGPLVIGDGVGALDSAVVRLLGINQVNDSSAVTIADDGLLDLNGNSDAIGALTVAGGDVATGAGTLTLGGDVTANASTNTANISGNLSLGNATRTFSIAAGTANPDLTISAVISGNAGAGITKTGSGSLQLSGTNTYSGVTAVNFGALEIFNPSALGSPASGTTLGSGSFLLLSGVTVAGESLTIVGTSAPLTSSGVAGWSGNIVLNGSLVLQVNSGTYTISGDISGPGSLLKNNPGTLILSGTNENTYAGTTAVNAGTLLLNKSPGVMAIPGALVIGDGAGGTNADVVRLLANSQIPDSSPITITGSGLLDTDGFTEVVGAVSGTGNLQLDSGTFSVGFSGQDVAFDGTISGSGNLIRNGSGTWSLNGTNTFSGNCTFNANTLVNGTLLANSISVSGTLGGTGTVGRVSMAVNGTISPGLSPGGLTTSNLAFIVTSKYRVELNGTTPGSDYDQLKVKGAVNNLASATLNATLGFLSPSNTSFIIIDNDGTDAVTNTFFGLGEGTTFNINGAPFRISYVGGTGNDVVLTQLADTQQPRLSIARAADTNVVLRWATNFTGFALESNTNLNTNVWAVVTNVPAVSGTNHVVTNAASGTQKYYRLRGP